MKFINILQVKIDVLTEIYVWNSLCYRQVINNFVDNYCKIRRFALFFIDSSMLIKIISIYLSFFGKLLDFGKSSDIMKKVFCV